MATGAFDMSFLPPEDMADSEVLAFQAVLDDGPGGGIVYMTAGEFRDLHSVADALGMTIYELVEQAIHEFVDALPENGTIQ